MNLRDFARDQSCVEKFCATCAQWKPRNAFTANRTTPDGLYSKCKPCKAAGAKAYYLENREAVISAVVANQKTARGKRLLKKRIQSYWARHPLKRRAHDAVREAKRNGSLVRQPCEKCGSEKADAHHDDYSQPLSVRWLCRTHHLEAHRAAA